MERSDPNMGPARARGRRRAAGLAAACSVGCALASVLVSFQFLYVAARRSADHGGSALRPPRLKVKTGFWQLLAASPPPPPRRAADGNVVEQGVMNKVAEPTMKLSTHSELKFNVTRVNSFDVAACRLPTSVADPFVGTGGVAHELVMRVVETASGWSPSSLLLMTHSRLLWFDTTTRTESLLLEQRDARFRGAFRSDSEHSLVVLSTPTTTSFQSVFVEVALLSGAVVRRVPADSTYDGHEVVRYGDRAYVVSTGSGAINVYATSTLKLVRTHALWSRRDHINTVAVTSSTLVVLLHNMRRRPSEAHIIDRTRDVAHAIAPT